MPTKTQCQVVKKQKERLLDALWICILNKNEDGFDINLYSPSFKRCRIGELTVIWYLTSFLRKSLKSWNICSRKDFSEVLVKLFVCKTDP